MGRIGRVGSIMNLLRGSFSAGLHRLSGIVLQTCNLSGPISPDVISGTFRGSSLPNSARFYCRYFSIDAKDELEYAYCVIAG